MVGYLFFTFRIKIDNIMNIIDNVLKGILGEEILNQKYRITVYGEKACMVSGVKSVTKYSPMQIDLLVKGARLSVYGEELTLNRFYRGDIVICGKVFKVEKTE